MTKQDQNSRAHDLLLLMVNLSQFTIKEKIIGVFVGALGEIWPGRTFLYQPVKPENNGISFEISASGSIYGYISIENMMKPGDEDLALLHNAAAMLAVILKKLDQDALLADEKLHLQKLVETTIRERENEFHTLAESMPQIVWMTRADGWNIYFNQQWVDYTGLSLEESYGDGWNKPFHPDDQQRAWDAWQNATKNNGPYSLECRLRRADGVYTWWLVRGVPVMDENDNILKWFGTCTNITELKLAELSLQEKTEEIEAQNEEYQQINEELNQTNRELSEAIKQAEESEAKYHLIFDKSLVAILVANDKGDYLSANNAAAELLGYAVEELLKMNVGDLKTTVKPGAQERYLKYLEKGEESGEFDFITKTEENRIAFYHAVRVRPDFNLTMLIDITRSKHAETELREKELQYHNLANAGPALIWRSGNDKLCNYFNESWLAFTGRTLEQELGNGWAEGVHPDDFDYCLATYIAAFEKHEPFEMEYRLRHVSGEYRWILDLGTPNKNSTGEFTGYLGNCFDITERKHAEALFADIVDKNPISIQIVDKKGCTLHGNPEYVRLFGAIPPPDFSIFDDLSGKSPELEKLVFHAKSGEVVHLPDIYYNAHDSVPEAPDVPLWIRALIFPLKDATGQPERFVFMHENITEQKQVERQLTAAKEKAEESEKRFRLLAENAQDMIYRMSIPDADYEYVSPASLEIFGYTPEEFYNTSFLIKKVVHPDWEEYFINEWQNLLDGKNPPSYEYQIIHKSGELKYLNQRNTLIRDDEGKPIAIEATVTDVTVQKHIENVLRAEKLFTELLINSLPGVYYLICEEGRFLRWNKKFEVITGRSAEEMAQISPMDLFEGDDKQAIAVAIQRVFTHGQVQVRAQVVAKDGKKTPYQFSGDKIIVDGKPNLIGLGIDISEQWQAEMEMIAAKEKAEESESFFRTIFENSPVGKSITGLDGTLKTNKAFSDMLGYSFDEFQTMSFNEITNPDDIQKSKDAIETLLKGEESAIRFEKKYIHKNGSTVFSEVVTTLQKDRNGEPLFFITSVIDITKRKHLEKIHEIQYNIATAVVASENVVQLLEFVRTELSQLFDTSNFFAALYNAKNNTLKKLHWVDEVDDFEEWDAAKSFSGYVVQTGKTWLLNRQEIAKLAAGQNIPITGTPAECWLGVPLTVDKKTIGVLVIQSYSDANAYDDSSALLFEQIAHDLSVFIEKSRILQDLNVAKLRAEESEALFSLFMQFSPVYAYIKEVSSAGSRVLISSDNFVDMTGIPSSEMKGKTMEELFPAEFATKITLDDLAVITKGEVLRLDEKFNTRSYTTIKFPIVRNGKTLLAGYTIDITERKLAEEKLLESQARITEALEASNRSRHTLLSVLEDQRRSEQEIQKLNTELERRVAERTEQLETANKELAYRVSELEQFSYVSNHDLQEPLRTLIQFTQLFNEKYTDTLDEEGQKYIEFISRSATRMSALVRDLLKYSLLGKESTMTIVDCNEIVKAVLSDLDDSIQKINARITVQKLPTLKGYETELSLLFQNLIGNAIKYQKKDMIPEVNISAESREKEWLFSIKDNGIGIDAKYIDKIFIIFQRLHNRNEYEGTGIGLAHCKKIVEMHGGKIWVESTPGAGSTFMFTIPK